MVVVGIIPARYGSTRFPGKPLARINGVSMIERVYKGALGAESLDDIRVATDDIRIAKACKIFGANVEMTRPDHLTGSDRIAEAIAKIRCDIVVNIQGDEPLIEGHVIDAAVNSLIQTPEAEVSTVAHAANVDDLQDPDRVKVVTNHKNLALYFSRAEIPFTRVPTDEVHKNRLQHVGLYAYRRSFLLDYVRFHPSALEKIESLEQLRILENGFNIVVARIHNWSSCPVDSPKDIVKVEKILLEK